MFLVTIKVIKYLGDVKIMGKFRDRIKNFLKNDKGDKDLDEILKISKKLDKLISKYMEKDKNE